MLTFFEYLRNRAYESIVLGANEALEFLEQDKSNPNAADSELVGLPRKRKSLDCTKSEPQSENQKQDSVNDDGTTDEKLPTPRRRGRPRKGEAGKQ